MCEYRFMNTLLTKVKSLCGSSWAGCFSAYSKPRKKLRCVHFGRRHHDVLLIEGLRVCWIDYASKCIAISGYGCRRSP